MGRSVVQCVGACSPAPKHCISRGFFPLFGVVGGGGGALGGLSWKGTEGAAFSLETSSMGRPVTLWMGACSPASYS